MSRGHGGNTALRLPRDLIFFSQELERRIVLMTLDATCMMDIMASGMAIPANLLSCWMKWGVTSCPHCSSNACAMGIHLFLTPRYELFTLAGLSLTNVCMLGQGGCQPCKVTTVHITSNYLPSQWWKEGTRYNREAIARRIHECHYHDKYKHYIRFVSTPVEGGAEGEWNYALDKLVHHVMFNPVNPPNP